MRYNFNPKKHKLYIPKNIDKYKGNVPIVMRSKLEQKIADWCDKTPSILWWSNENLAIPYYNPIKQRIVNYYPDFVIHINTINGIKTFVVEVKPSKKLYKPKLSEKIEFLINNAKFKACIKFCELYGYEFKIITEKIINKL